MRQFPSVSRSSAELRPEAVHEGIKVVQAYNRETGVAFEVDQFDNGHFVVNVIACALLAFSFTETLSSTTLPQVGQIHPKDGWRIYQCESGVKANRRGDR